MGAHQLNSMLNTVSAKIILLNWVIYNHWFPLRKQINTFLKELDDKMFAIVQLDQKGTEEHLDRMG